MREGLDPFVGREKELDLLVGHGQSLDSGTGWVDLIAGEPGIGKTRLVQEYLSNQNSAAYVGNCMEGGIAPPYWPWKRIIETLSASADLETFFEKRTQSGQYLCLLNPTTFLPFISEDDQAIDSAELQQGEHQFYLFQAVYDFLVYILKEGPLVIVLEDLHWADVGSCDLLRFIVSQVAELPLHVIGTYRNTDLGAGAAFAPMIGWLQVAPNVSISRLGGLSEEAIESLVRDIGIEAGDHTLAADIRGRTDGNSLFVRILAAELSQNSKNAQLRSLPEGIRHLVARMISKLSKEHLETICYAAVLGREYPIKRLAEVMENRSLSEIIDAVDAAVDLTILDHIPPHEGRYRFHHEVIRHAIVEELNLSKRVQMHAVCARRLEALREHDHEISDEELFGHFSESEVVSDPDKIAQYALRAGNNALQIYDLAAAETFYARGLEAVNGRQTEVSGWLNIGMARCKHVRFDVYPEEYNANLKSGLEYALAQNDTNLLKSMITAMDPPIQSDSGTTSLFARIIELLQDDEAMRLLMAESMRYGLLFHGKPIPDELNSLLQSGLKKAETDSPMLAVRVLSSQAHLCHLKGQYERQLNLALRIGEIDRTGDPSFIFRRYHHEQDALARLGRYSEVELNAHRTEHIAVDHIGDFGGRWTLAWIHGVYVDVADWESEARARKIIESAQPRIALHSFDWSTIRMWIEFDDLGKVERFLETTHIESVYTLLYLLMYLPLYGMKTGNHGFANALRAILREWVNSAIPRVKSSRAGALAYIGMVDDDRAAVLRHLPDIDPLMHDFAWQYYGVLKAYLGDIDGAVQSLEQGLKVRQGRTLRIAWLHFHIAETLAHVDSTKASEHLSIAIEMADQYGLQLLRRRIGELADTPSVSARNIGKFGLTARELEILKEISMGKTDAEIAESLYISVKTVSNHVGNILRKTNVGNRTEAARIAIDQRLLD